MKTFLYVPLFGLVFLLTLQGCTRSHEQKHKGTPPAKVEKHQNEKLPFVILTQEAETRIGIVTEPLENVRLNKQVFFRIPVSSILYDTEGNTWVYIRIPSSNLPTFQRREVKLIKIDEKSAHISSDFSAPSEPVVTVGTAELYGAETGVGK